MRVAQIVPYIGDEASCPAYSVPALCEALKRNGCDVILYTLEPLPKRGFEFQIKGFKRSSLPSYSFGRSPNKYYTLLKDCKNVDIIHNHTFLDFKAIIVGRILKIPVVWHLHSSILSSIFKPFFSFFLKLHSGNYICVSKLTRKIFLDPTYHLKTTIIHL